jgi:raffinose/stachyose/melibiose transport system substrate-binding protein
MRKKMLSFAILLLAVLVAVAPNLSSRAAAQEDKVLKIWHYESPNGAMGIAWQAAMDKFQELHPDVTIEFEARGFEEIRQTAPM